MQNSTTHTTEENSTKSEDFVPVLPIDGCPEILTLFEVAAILRIDETTAAKLFVRKELVGFKVGRQWRMRRDALLAHVQLPEKPHAA